MRRRPGKRTPVALGLLLLLVVAAGCGRKPAPAGRTAGEPPAHTPTPSVSDTVELSSAAVAEAGIATWKVEPVDLEHMLVLNGTVRYDENRLVRLASNVSGRVAAIPVDLGARVRQGEPLVWIESAELGRAREELVRELSQLRVASRAYERARRLVEQKAISQGEFQVREGDFLSKKAAADAAERALQLLGETKGEIDRIRAAIESGQDAGFPPSSRMAIRAPFDGRVLERQATPGSVVEPMQPILTFANLSTLWVFLQAYEKDLALLRSGLPLRIRTDAYPQETFSGRLDFLGGAVDEGTRTVGVRATVQNTADKLRPGMFVKAQVEVPRPQAENKPILAVPQSAFQTFAGRTVVFVETSPGRFARRAVETGHTFEGFTEILSGVKPGEAVVTEGGFVLKSEFAKAELEGED
ncbi:MAG: efflux RND transporter periplasmic adaptor subunit [Thermoanaerobaculia bacterium]